MEPDEATPTVIGSGSHFDGLLSFRGAARVDGVLTGRVEARGRLEIGPQAHVQARIEVDELVIEGRVEGELRIRERAELAATAVVVGSLVVPRLCMAEGGVLQGSCATTPPTEQASDEVLAEGFDAPPPGEVADDLQAPDSTAKSA